MVLAFLIPLLLYSVGPGFLPEKRKLVIFMLISLVL